MKTVVFDLDGTLADTSGDLLAAANATFAALGYAPPLGVGDEALAHRGGRAMLRVGFARLNIAADEARIADLLPMFIGHYEAALCLQTRLYGGAEAAVRTLRARGFSCTICTNKPTYLAEILVQSLGIRHLFDVLIGAGSLPTVKPDPAPYFAAVHPHLAAHSMLIGDTDTDLNTARAAGVPCALVTFGPNGQNVASLAPDALLHHFQDLPDLAAHILGRPN